MLSTIGSHNYIPQVGNTWQTARFQVPEFSPGQCRTPSLHCSNTAYVHVYCWHCCKRKYHLDVGKSTFTINGKSTGLGLFALKTFASTEYVCDHVYDMLPNKQGFGIRELCTDFTVSGHYALEVNFQGRRLEGDASQIRIGNRRASGLVRYCNESGRNKNNAVFSKKDETTQTWGIRVMKDKVINKGDEIFVSYGPSYWETYKY
jgi:hypothetical protein